MNKQAGAELGQAQLSYTLASQSSWFDQVNSKKFEQMELKNHVHQIILNTYIFSYCIDLIKFMRYS